MTAVKTAPTSHTARPTPLTERFYACTGIDAPGIGDSGGLFRGRARAAGRAMCHPGDPGRRRQIAVGKPRSRRCWCARSPRFRARPWTATAPRIRPRRLRRPTRRWSRRQPRASPRRHVSPRPAAPSATSSSLGLPDTARTPGPAWTRARVTPRRWRPRPRDGGARDAAPGDEGQGPGRRLSWPS